VNERDTIASEASRSFRKHNWSVNVTRDAVRCPRCGTIIYPDAAAGCFDIRIGVPVWNQENTAWYAVEVKYGKTAYSFSDFDDKKRKWAESHTGDYSMWIWLGMGVSIRDEKYPRATYLFPLDLFYRLETTLERKSIPYDCPELDKYKLQWLGGGTWAIHDLFLKSLVFAKTD